jgi:hypothetical protein
MIDRGDDEIDALEGSCEVHIVMGGLQKQGLNRDSETLIELGGDGYGAVDDRLYANTPQAFRIETVLHQRREVGYGNMPEPSLGGDVLNPSSGPTEDVPALSQAFLIGHKDPGALEDLDQALPGETAVGACYRPMVHAELCRYHAAARESISGPQLTHVETAEDSGSDSISDVGRCGHGGSSGWGGDRRRSGWPPDHLAEESASSMDAALHGTGGQTQGDSDFPIREALHPEKEGSAIASGDVVQSGLQHGPQSAMAQPLEWIDLSRPTGAAT